MANLHLSLAIQLGLDNEFTKKASYLCSVQVDFAKHGRCIKTDSMDSLQKKEKGRLRFLLDDDRADQGTYETDHIIQKLWEQVDLPNLHKQCLEIEHKYSIMHEYKMNSHIIKLSTNEDLKQFLKTAKYFKDVYLQFIYPMEEEIRSKLLMKYKIINEGELFCSDFRYRVTEGKPLDFIGMISKSNEET